MLKVLIEILLSSFKNVFIGKLLEVIYYSLDFRQDLKMQELHTKSNKTNGRWTKEEHLKFLEGLRVYGKNWRQIQKLVATRSCAQIRSHAQKFFLKSLPNSKKEEDGNQVFSDQMIEQQLQEMTLNSKTISESGLRLYEFSFYLDKIIKHCSVNQNLDFWTSLVDCNGKAANSNQNLQNNSFTNFERPPVENRPIQQHPQTLL